MKPSPETFSIEKSLNLFSRSSKVIPAGVGSNARLMDIEMCHPYQACTLFAKKAHGAYLTDVDNNTYIDYRLGFGPAILGHSHPATVKAVKDALEGGFVYALDTEKEISVAETIRNMVPCAEMVRFTNSGTESTMAAIKVARGFTGKKKLLKFEGHYHGWHDAVMVTPNHTPFDIPKGRMFWKSREIPQEVRSLTLTATFNDFNGFEEKIKRNHNQLACVIMEPIMGNASGIMPDPGFLKHVQEVCTKYGVLLIFDEVKTGFRVHPGGAQSLYKVKPDIATFSKCMGNGHPIGCFAGTEEIMSVIGPKKVAHGGTYSANPVSLSVCEATLREIRKESNQEKFTSFTKKLMNGMSSVLKQENVPHLMSGHPRMFQWLPTKKKKIDHYHDLEHVDTDIFSRVQFESLRRGVMFDVDYQEVIFSSFAHGKKELNETLDTFSTAVQTAKAAKRTRIDNPMGRSK
ncbi:MAG: aspartate aminotransferase family protein [archaeon]